MHPTDDNDHEPRDHPTHPVRTFVLGLEWTRGTDTRVGLIWARTSHPHPCRVCVPVRLGDWITTREPNYQEMRSLDLAAGEGVWDIWRAAGTREILPASLVAICPSAGVVLEAFHGVQRTVHTEHNAAILTAEFPHPDPAAPRWQQIYTDLAGHIQGRWLRPGDKVPTVEDMATMYQYSRTSSLRALKRLQADGWVTSRYRSGTYVNPHRTTPISELVYADLRADIHSGRMRPGDELPTIPALARTYQCSASTVRRALYRLHTDDLIEGRRGLGVFVTDPGKKPYRKGERVALVHTNDPDTKLRPGDEGTILRHDTASHTVDVAWDHGPTLTLCLDAGDRIRRLGQQP